MRGGCEVDSKSRVCVLRPRLADPLSDDFLRFRLGLFRLTDPPCETRREKNRYFWVRTWSEHTDRPPRSFVPKTFYKEIKE